MRLFCGMWRVCFQGWSCAMQRVRCSVYFKDEMCAVCAAVMIMCNAACALQCVLQGWGCVLQGWLSTMLCVCSMGVAGMRVCCRNEGFWLMVWCSEQGHTAQMPDTWRAPTQVLRQNGLWATTSSASFMWCTKGQPQALSGGIFVTGGVAAELQE